MKQKKIIMLTISLVFAARLESNLVITDPGEISLPDVDGTGDLITIAVNNVTLNLEGAIISGATRALVINSNLSNITIKNGAIDNSTIGISIGANCSNITLENLEITNCSDRAIETLGFSGNTISNLFMEHIKISQCCTGVSADFILSLTFCKDVEITDLLMDENGLGGISLTAVNIETSTRCFLNDIRIASNTCDTFTAIIINGSVDCCIENCKISTNTTSDGLIGIVITGGSAIEGNALVGCQVVNNETVNGPLIGFDFQPFVTRNVLRECIVSNNLVTGVLVSSSCIGFNFDQSTFCSIIRCRAMQNRATGNGTSNICTGFNIGSSAGGATGTRNCEFLENTFVNNNGFIDAQSFGLRAITIAGGNLDNAYLMNVALRNGPTSPLGSNQITSTGGAGSSPGGVPAGSLNDRTVSNLSAQRTELANYRII